MYRILMYSHDTYGLGHIRRTLAIAQSLASSGTHILIITGSPLAGSFTLPPGADYVRLPGIIKQENGIYQPSAARLDTAQVISIRKALILAAAQSFSPHLFIVDKEPLGLKREVVPALEWLRAQCPGTRTVLGLRDIMDHARAVKAHWHRIQAIPAMERLYSEIWVYGCREIFDPVQAYGIPEAVRSKLIFTGYLERIRPGATAIRIAGKSFAPGDLPRILVTTGGGKDGLALLDAFLDYCQSLAPPFGFSSHLVTGPFLRENDRKRVQERAGDLGIGVTGYCRGMNSLMGACDFLVCMGGYNTLCEALSQQIPTLAVPRQTPRQEQLIRARAMHGKGLLDYLPWTRLSPENLGSKIAKLRSQGSQYRAAMAGFPMQGIQAIQARVRGFQKNLPREER